MWRHILSSDVMHTNEELANETYWYIIHEINHDENRSEAKRKQSENVKLAKTKIQERENKNRNFKYK